MYIGSFLISIQLSTIAQKERNNDNKHFPAGIKVFAREPALLKFNCRGIFNAPRSTFERYGLLATIRHEKMHSAAQQSCFCNAS
jgi:hypothetical protein